MQVKLLQTGPKLSLTLQCRAFCILQFIPEEREIAWMLAQHLLTQSDREHLGGEVSTSVVKGPICSPAITSSNVSDVSNIPSLLNI